MGTISEKLVYLNGTKQAIKQAINEDFEVIDNNSTFREYAEEISSNNTKYKDLIPKETTNATNTLDISNSSGLDKALVTQYGNTHQEGEPTPDAPQEIVNISGKSNITITDNNNQEQSFDLDLKSKNLLNGTSNFSGLWTNNYLWETDDSTYNGYVVKKRSGQWQGVYKEIPVVEGKTYTFSLFLKSDSPRACAIYTQGGTGTIIPENKLLTSTTSWQRYSITFTASSSGTIRPRVENTESDIGNYTYIAGYQLEENSTATEYEPFYDINICKIGNYKDRIYPLNGKWYLEKKIGKVVLDGSKTYSINTKSDSFLRFNYDNSNIKIANNNTDIFCKCNNFKGVPYQTILSTGLNQIALSNNTNRLFININPELIGATSSMTNSKIIDLFKTWLSTHNTIAYFVLATPTTEEITESNYPTLYNQLNNIKLFEGVNHITMTNESGLDVEFDITYYKDWKLD